MQGSQSTEVWQKKGLASIGSVGICVVLLQKDVSFTALISGRDQKVQWDEGFVLLILGGMLGAPGASQLGGLISAAGALKKKKKKCIQSFLLKW